jgi:hypothetical protein
MGYTQGMLSLREMFVVRTEQLEYSVRNVLRLDNLECVSTLLDVEALGVEPDGEQLAQQLISEELSRHKITALLPAEWERWVRDTYEKVDLPFENSPANVRKRLRQLEGFLSSSLIDN